MRTWPGKGILICVASVAALVSPVGARAASAPDAGRPFIAIPVSEPLYGVRAPSDRNGQRHFVVAADGVRLFVETWLPVAKGGNVPPPRIPTVVSISPYLALGRDDSGFFDIPDLVSRGYAYSQAHTRGTGESGGCLEQTGAREIDDGARIIEYLGRDAPWSDGNVGAIGISYEGGAALAPAALGNRVKVQYLKAIIAFAPATSYYDSTYGFDGVPYFTQSLATSAGYLGQTSLAPGSNPSGKQYVEKLTCQPKVMTDSVDMSGDVTPLALERELRAGAGNVTAATMIFQGHADGRVPPVSQAGFFERLPATTPKVGIFGLFDHDTPANHRAGVHPEWEWAEQGAMLMAWYDRYLKGLPTGVEQWPTALVQGNDGQWRGEADWPTTGGPVGQLALGPGGSLGTSTPSGSSSYVEGLFETSRTGPAPGTAVIFETRPLPDRLEITGQPVLDLWVSLDRPDAHLAARIEVLDRAGARVPYAHAVGFRSMRHLDPLVNNRFVQKEGKAPPVARPVRVSLRFNPTDLVVPRGGRLRVVIAGSLIWNEGLGELTEFLGLGEAFGDVLIGGPSQPSFAFTRVTILHDCQHSSALRFLMPRVNPDLLNVREKDEPAGEPLADNRPSVAPVSDAGGIATAPVCGQAPIRLENFGPEIPYEPPSRER